MNDRTWGKSIGVTIEQRLDGNINVTHKRHGMVSEVVLSVEDGVVDVTAYKRDYVEEHLREPLEDAGYTLDMSPSESDDSSSLIQRIKTLITPQS